MAYFQNSYSNTEQNFSHLFDSLIDDKNSSQFDVVKVMLIKMKISEYFHSRKIKIKLVYSTIKNVA